MSKKVVLICGESGTGKSASLRNLKNQEKVLYLCCEAGKDLPFKSKFKEVVVTHPKQVLEGIAWAEKNKYETVVIDTVDFLMNMFESEVVNKSSNTMRAWGDYQQYFVNLMQQVVAKSELNFIFLAHTRTDINEDTGDTHTYVPVKGALKGQGLEAYFNVIVGSKKVSVKKLKDFENDLLKITEADERMKIKYVYQTQLTDVSVNERIRGPMDLFTYEETFIDNDAQQLLDRLINYYS